jgi:2-desacetyl-2-hydroxyethyl bacteriochlorophyllide A dehydrogenase
MDKDSAAARAFWVATPGQGEIRTAPLTTPGPNETLVETTRSAISRGTEALVFSGRVPESQYDAMRCPFQDGDFPGPVKYGYASAGIVSGAMAGAAGKDARRVFCLYPHQDRYVAPRDSLIDIPDEVSDDRAVLAANMETAVNAMWDAGPLIGDQIAIVGGGVVGCMVAALCGRIPGARVELVDVNPRRAAIASALNVGFAAPNEAEKDVDIVFHASGVDAGLATALGLAGFEALVMEMSWYGDRMVSAPLGEAFHAKRLTLQSSQVGAVSGRRRARRTHRQRLTFAMDVLRDPVFDCLITGRSGFADLPETMAGLARDPGDALCHVVTYS